MDPCHYPGRGYGLPMGQNNNMNTASVYDPSSIYNTTPEGGPPSPQNSPSQRNLRSRRDPPSQYNAPSRQITPSKRKGAPCPNSEAEREGVGPQHRAQRPALQDRTALYENQSQNRPRNPKNQNENQNATPPPFNLPRQNAMYVAAPFFLHGGHAICLNKIFPKGVALPKIHPARLFNYRIIPTMYDLQTLYPSEVADPDIIADGIAVFPTTVEQTRAMEALARFGALEIESVKIQVWYDEWRTQKIWGKAIVWRGTWEELEWWREELIKREEKRLVEAKEAFRDAVMPKVVEWLEKVEPGRGWTEQVIVWPDKKLLWDDRCTSEYE